MTRMDKEIAGNAGEAYKSYDSDNHVPVHANGDRIRTRLPGQSHYPQSEEA